MPVAAGAAGLSKADRGLLAKALVQRERVVTLLVAVHPGAEADVAARLHALGATVAYRDDDVGYLRADVPARRAVDAAALTGVAAVSVDQVVAHGDPAVPTDDPPALPGPDTPAANPLVPTQDMVHRNFVAAHPTFDGRGTTLGIVDDGVGPPHARAATRAARRRHRRGQDRRLRGYNDPSDDPTWSDYRTGQGAQRQRLVRRRELRRPPTAGTASVCSTSALPGPRCPTSTATATRPEAAASSVCCGLFRPTASGSTRIRTRASPTSSP